MAHTYGWVGWRGSFLSNFLSSSFLKFFQKILCYIYYTELMAGEQSSWYFTGTRVAVQKSSVIVSKGIRCWGWKERVKSQYIPVHQESKHIFKRIALFSPKCLWSYSCWVQFSKPRESLEGVERQKNKKVGKWVYEKGIYSQWKGVWGGCKLQVDKIFTGYHNTPGFLKGSG